MLPSHSPFPCHWWGTSFDDVGLRDIRPDVGTYGRYQFDRLPPLPFEMRGDFAWLYEAPTFDFHIGAEHSEANSRALVILKRASARLGLPLPDTFTTFIETAALQARIRSNTDCFLDLCSEPVGSPLGEGYLIRFLADSQGCIFWYLYLTQDGSDHAVVSSPGFYGSEAEDWQEETADPADIVFSAESFEAFMCRFWLENEIWFAALDKRSMPEGGIEYIERYRHKD